MCKIKVNSEKDKCSKFILMIIVVLSVALILYRSYCIL